MTQQAYFNTTQLCERYHCKRGSLYRWMARDNNPMPRPCHPAAGSKNLWAAADIANWEESSRQRAA